MSGNKKELLIYVIDNAFDFLKTAINEFGEKTPKYSILHFTTAIELFLKARLIKEHWSLIINDKNINQKKFENGDFYSINVSESIHKIRSIVGEKFPEDYQNAFIKIATHRNKLVHFFHPKINDDSNHARDKIAGELCLGWYYLKILIENWRDIFTSHHKQIEELTKMMTKHRAYLNTVYNQIKERIRAEEDNGTIFKVCPSCQFKSCKQSKVTDNILNYRCWICTFEEEVISIGCPACNQSIEITESENEPFVCSNCDSLVDNNHIADVLNTEGFNYDHFPKQIINCANCCSHNSVVIHHDFFICSHCRSISKDAPMCEWCSERQISGGNLEESFLRGCQFCDGRLGHMKDD